MDGSPAHVELVESDGSAVPVALDELAERVADRFAWIDVTTDGRRDWQSVAAALGVDPMLESQGDSADPFRVAVGHDQFEMLVPFVRGVEVVLVHVLATFNWLATSHDGRPPALDALRRGDSRPVRPAQGLFLVAQAALTSFRPDVESAREQIEDLEDELFDNPSASQLVQLAQLRRRLVLRRRIVSAYASDLDVLVGELSTRDDVKAEGRQLAVLVADQASALSHNLQAAEEAVGHAIETYTSVVATRQGQVVNRLTVVSMVFLPLTFLTGFFGMNFAWLTNHITGTAAFWLLGVALQVLLLVIIVTTGQRLRWMRGFTELPEHSERDDADP